MGFLASIKKFFNYRYNFVNEYDQREALLYIKRNKVLLKEIEKNKRKAFEDEFLNLVDNEINKKHRNLNENEIFLLINRLRIRFASRINGDIRNTILERLNLLSNELRIIQSSINANNQNFDIIQLNKLILKIRVLISKNEFDNSIIVVFNRIDPLFENIRTFKKSGIKNNLSRDIDSVLNAIVSLNVNPSRQASAAK